MAVESKNATILARCNDQQNRNEIHPVSMGSLWRHVCPRNEATMAAESKNDN